MLHCSAQRESLYKLLRPPSGHQLPAGVTKRSSNLPAQTLLNCISIAAARRYFARRQDARLKRVCAEPGTFHTATWEPVLGVSVSLPQNREDNTVEVSNKSLASECQLLSVSNCNGAGRRVQPSLNQLPVSEPAQLLSLLPSPFSSVAPTGSQTSRLTS